MESMNSFSEPRAWALQWDGDALARASALQPADPRGWEGIPGWRVMALPAAGVTAPYNGSGHGNGHANGHASWPEPNSWALAWDPLPLAGELAAT